MTTLLARLGQLETRAKPPSTWTIGKRKRAPWVCRECRARSAQRQTRLLSNQASRPVAIGVEDVPSALQVERDSRLKKGEEATASPRKRSSTARAPRGKSYGSFQGNDDLGRGDERSLSENQNIGVAAEGSGRIVYPNAHTYQATGDAPASSSSRGLNLSMLDVDYKNAFVSALQNRDADLVLRCILAASRKGDLKFIRDISTADFCAALDVLQPKELLADIAPIYSELSEAKTERMGIASMRSIVRDVSSALEEVFDVRHISNSRLSLGEYEQLLQAAQYLGSLPMASRVWNTLLADGNAPDVACYNNYMAAIVWNRRHDQRTHAGALKVTEYNREARQQLNSNPKFASYKTGPNGLKETIMKLFDAMLRAKLTPTEESFNLLMTAAAKDGDLTSVKATLRKVWDIDVDAPTKKSLFGFSRSKNAATLGSHQTPTSSLLFTVAHAFGINNDVSTAVRVVNQIARRYNIEITSDVWSELFDRTVVSASLLTGQKNSKDRFTSGQLPKHTVLEFMKAITGEPYRLRPTVLMYHGLIGSLRRRDAPLIMLPYIAQGNELTDESRATAAKKLAALEEAAENQSTLGSAASEPVALRALQAARREYEIADLERSRNHKWALSWIRMLLEATRDWIRVDEQGDWTLRQLPRLLWNLQHLAPGLVSYEIPGGRLEFRRKTANEWKESGLARVEKIQKIEELISKGPLFLGENWLSQGASSRPVAKTATAPIADSSGSSDKPHTPSEAAEQQ